VSGIVGVVSSAKLRLYVTDASPDGGSVYLVGNEWTETGITWNTAPPISGTALSSVGATAVGSWVEFDVAGAITGTGTVSFAIKGPSSDTVYYGSRENANKPQLVVTP
jgi:hypothetical protein